MQNSRRPRNPPRHTDPSQFRKTIERGRETKATKRTETRRFQDALGTYLQVVLRKKHTPQGRALRKALKHCRHPSLAAHGLVDTHDLLVLLAHWPRGMIDLNGVAACLNHTAQPHLAQPAKNQSGKPQLQLNLEL